MVIKNNFNKIITLIIKLNFSNVGRKGGRTSKNKYITI